MLFSLSLPFSLQNISLSVNDLLSCCGFMCGDGCDGGYPIRAWHYFVQNGVVTDEVIAYVNISFSIVSLITTNMSHSIFMTTPFYTIVTCSLVEVT